MEKNLIVLSTNEFLVRPEKEIEILLLCDVLNVENVRKIESKIFELLSSEKYVKLFEYLFPVYDHDVFIVRGTDSYGLSHSYNICEPFWYDAQFSYDMYPVNNDCSMFESERPFDYLTTFNVGSLREVDSEKERVVYKAVKRMLAIQSQSRFSNIWRELASSVLAVDSITGTGYNPIRLWLWVLVGKKYKSFPFYEQRGEIVFENDDVPSILPTIMYMLMSVAMDIVLGTCSVIEAFWIIDRYIRLASKSYMDEKLRTKSAMRNWVQEAMCIVGSDMCLIWDETMKIDGIYRKNLSEPKIVRKEIAQAENIRKEKLDKVDYDYIEIRLKKLKKVEDIERLFQLCHAASNDRTYYKTIVELCLDAAVQPQLRMNLLESAQPTKLSTAKQHVLMLGYEHMVTGNAASEASKYLDNYVPVLTSKLSGINLNNEWIRFITTSSAGKKLNDNELLQYGKLAKLFHNRRLFRVAIEMSEFSNPDRILMSIVDKTMLVVRQQIDRRQRTIAGLSNAKLEITFPGYMIGKTFYDVTTEAAQGKQTGGMMDAVSLLVVTSKSGLITNSLDISGMDASIQPSARKPYDILTLKVSNCLINKQFGPWRDQFLSVMNISVTAEGSNYSLPSREMIPALQLAIGYQASTIQTSTTYKSDLFGMIQTQEGTFESGRTDTSTHHTVLLISVLNANSHKRRRDGFITTVRDTEIMGDDVRRTYFDNGKGTENEIEDDVNVLNNLGFETTNDLSSNYAVFLQQIGMVGRIIGLPNRVSLFTREHVKVIGSLSAACSELNSLCDDLINRVKNAENIDILRTAIGLFCISRHTIELDDKSFNYVNSEFMKQDILTQTYVHKRVGTKLLTIYAPYVWLYMYGGGEMSAPSFEWNGTVIKSKQSVLCPRGQFKRKILLDLARNEGLKWNELDKSMILKDFGFHRAQFLIDLNIFELEKNSRINDEGMVELSQLAVSLDSLEDRKLLDRSGIGYATLRNNGASIPRSIVFAYNNYTRLEQLVTSGEEDNIDVERFSRSLTYSIRKYKYTMKSSDVFYDYFAADSEEDVTFNDDAHFVRKVPFITCMHDANFYWYVYSLIGGPTGIEGFLRKEISSIRGKFHNFKYSDPVFEFGVKVFRQHPSLLEPYMDAINLREKERAVFKQALEYYITFGDINVKYIMSPRQSYALSLNPENLQSNYLSSVSIIKILSYKTGYIGVTALMLTYAYLNLLETCYYPTYKKIDITLSKDLISKITLNNS